MEKNHFKDRPELVQRRSEIVPGSEVLICTKEAQKSACRLDDLERIQVSQRYTSQPVHPRGIKVSGMRIGLGKQAEVCKGRVTYRIDYGNLVWTRQGWKHLLYDGSHQWLASTEEANGFYRVWILYTSPQGKMRAALDPALALTKEQAVQMQQKLRNSSFVLSDAGFEGPVPVPASKLQIQMDGRWYRLRVEKLLEGCPDRCLTLDFAGLMIEPVCLPDDLKDPQ